MTCGAGGPASQSDARVRWLIEWIGADLLEGCSWNRHHLIVFTEWETTRRWLERRLRNVRRNRPRGRAARSRMERRLRRSARAPAQSGERRTNGGATCRSARSRFSHPCWATAAMRPMSCTCISIIALCGSGACRTPRVRYCHTTRKEMIYVDLGFECACQ